jgi:shikimate kinase
LVKDKKIKESLKMAYTRRLEAEQDFIEAMEKKNIIRVFQDNHVVASGGTISRIEDKTVVIQSGVSELHYFQKDDCEFFEIKK